MTDAVAPLTEPKQKYLPQQPVKSLTIYRAVGYGRCLSAVVWQESGSIGQGTSPLLELRDARRPRRDAFPGAGIAEAAYHALVAVAIIEEAIRISV
jgi:hypothetical protein